MARAALPLLFLAGCNQILGLDPVGTGDGGEVRIDAADAEPDAEPDASPDANPDDVDGDGASNNADNCRDVPNPTQDDEDLDGLGDRCDPCPYLDGTGGGNVDGDGIGDGCDGDLVGRQCIVWFDGFHHDTLASYRTAGDGTWILSTTTGSIVQSNAGGLDTLFATNVELDQPWARTSGSVLQRSGINNGEPYAVGVWLRADQAPLPLPDGCIATVTQDPSPSTPSGLYLRRAMNGQQATLDGSLLGPEVNLGAAFAITADDAGDAFDAYGTLGTMNTSVSSPGICRNRAGAVGLRTHQVAAQFDYLMVAAPHPSCPPAPAPCVCPPPLPE